TCASVWPLFAGGAYVGQVTSATWSPDFNTNVAIGMVARSHWNAGTRLEVDTSNGMRTAIVQEKFWI
ncbi:MAG: glycine cleavage T C-terminal barrel domain-containing protein, partial [Paracoccaceae bacterium]|nr:glycine cleavage T C-terminal barrel domain-containing protein [Paracoccaceae bacterium]